MPGWILGCGYGHLECAADGKQLVVHPGARGCNSIHSLDAAVQDRFLRVGVRCVLIRYQKKPISINPLSIFFSQDFGSYNFLDFVLEDGQVSHFENSQV